MSNLKEGTEPYELSDYAKFHLKLRGYRFVSHSGVTLDRREVYQKGYTDISTLLAERYPVFVTKIPNRNEGK